MTETEPGPQGVVAWRLHQAKGSVRLGRARGALSTIEVVATPLALGYIAVPRLSLRGVADTHAGDVLLVTNI